MSERTLTYTTPHHLWTQQEHIIRKYASAITPHADFVEYVVPVDKARILSRELAMHERMVRQIDRSGYGHWI